MSPLVRTLLASTTVAALAVGSSASANERNFSFTYQSATLPQGQAELEPWSTAQFGKSAWDIRMDNRLEFEVGVTDDFQAALYFITRSTASKGFQWKGNALELKYRLLDAVADPLGFALYLEGFLATDQKKLEPKLIIDKYFGDWVFALNAVFEAEWKEHDTEYEAKGVGGLGYFVSKTGTVGLEAEVFGKWENGDHEKTEYWLGPSFSYGDENYWVTFATVLQPWNRTNDAGEGIDWVKGRVLLGFPL
jgi:hypothetical protein